MQETVLKQGVHDEQNQQYSSLALAGKHTRGQAEYHKFSSIAGRNGRALSFCQCSHSQLQSVLRADGTLGMQTQPHCVAAAGLCSLRMLVSFG